jgi:CheY-like chemotaxis protein
VNANTVLLIDADPAANADLRRHFTEAGVCVEAATDGLHAMESLRDHRYCAVVLDPVIRERLNGYAVLDYIEMEQPRTLSNLFLLTGMSKQTIQRTAPALLPRLYRKPHEGAKLANAVLATCAHQARPTRKSSLLLVEDDPAAAAIVSAIVEERGYEVTRADDGSEALVALANRDFDAIVLDLIMPELDGFSVLERLQSTKPYLVRRVIVTTGIPERYGGGFDLNGVCGLLRKPIDVSELKRLLDRCTLVGTFEPGGEYPSMM